MWRVLLDKMKRIISWFCWILRRHSQRKYIVVGSVDYPILIGGICLGTPKPRYNCIIYNEDLDKRFNYDTLLLDITKVRLVNGNLLVWSDFGNLIFKRTK